MYDSVRNFNKYNVPNFNEISSIVSKFDTINKFYKDLLKLSVVKSRSENKKQKKIGVLKNASVLYYELINMYKKEYEQVFEVKDEDWMEKHDYKNLKDLNHQVDKVNKADKEKKDEDKADKTDEELLPWIEPKDEFNKLKNRNLSVKDNKLKTGTDKYLYDFSYTKELIRYIANNKITKNNAINRVKEESALEIKGMKRSGNGPTIINFNSDLIRLFSSD